MIKKIRMLALVTLIVISASAFSLKELETPIIVTPQLPVSSGIGQNITGSYDGDISLVYFDFNSDFTSWFDQNSSTSMIPHNRSVNNKEFVLNRLEIYSDNIINESGSGEYIIANNTKKQLDPTSSRMFVQQFTAPDLIAIDEIRLYLNYSMIMIPEFSHYYMVLRIYNENFQEEIDVIWIYESRMVLDEWIVFYPRANIFQPGETYSLVLHLWSEKFGALVPFNFWKAENYTSPSFNKGLTARFDGTSWLPFTNDATTDLLCFFSYKKIVDPAAIDLKYIINNETVVPVYQQSSFGMWGYEGYFSYTLENQLDSPLNVTVTTNQTIPALDVYIEMYYIHLVNATGTYNVKDNLNEWTIDYYYEEISFGWPPPIFLFERDWDFDTFLDPDDVTMDEIYFGPMNLYNKSYYGVTIFFGPPLERGFYTGIFHSPNYCNIINSKIKSGSQFVIRSSLELGQTIMIDAEIRNTFNQPISGGSGQILITSASGSIILNETGLTSINGLMSSSEVLLNSELGEGFYIVEIFWTNGKEIAFYSVQIQVEDPAKIVFFVGIIIGIAAASTPLAIVARKQIKQRNWKKSLKNLFVLTKDGVSLYEYSFGIEIQDPALISAMIAALTNFVREATGSKKALRTVDQEDKKVLLYHGDYVTVALLSEKDLPIIHKRIKKFTELFEVEYGKHLEGWKGETTIFKGTEVILNKQFPLDVEEQVIRGVKQKLLEFRQQLDILNDPVHIISLMRHINDFISRYQAVVNQHYINYYFEIVKIAEEKISLA
ncbi:MAG: hypothetical protein ACTSQL_02235 [Promethearchaeota archaeon]